MHVLALRLISVCLASVLVRVRAPLVGVPRPVCCFFSVARSEHAASTRSSDKAARLTAHANVCVRVRHVHTPQRVYLCACVLVCLCVCVSVCLSWEARYARPPGGQVPASSFARELEI